MIDGRRYHGNVKNDLGYFLELEIEKKRANHRNPGIENVNQPLKEDVSHLLSRILDSIKDINIELSFKTKLKHIFIYICLKKYFSFKYFVIFFVSIKS